MFINKYIVLRTYNRRGYPVGILCGKKWMDGTSRYQSLQRGSIKHFNRKIKHLNGKFQFNFNGEVTCMHAVASKRCPKVQ